MKIKSLFSTETQKPFEQIEFEKRTSVIRNPDGSIVFEMIDIVVPKHWSQVATDIIAQKYFRKAGVPKVSEESKRRRCPEWLSRSEPDIENNDRILPEEERYISETDSQTGFSPLSRMLDLLGMEA